MVTYTKSAKKKESSWNTFLPASKSLKPCARNTPVASAKKQGDHANYYRPRTRKSMATPSLLTHIIGNKYQFALPLYRQEMVFKQLKFNVNRKTLSNWMIRSAAMLELLLLRLKTQQLAQQLLHADETSVVLLPMTIKKVTCGSTVVEAIPLIPIAQAGKS